MRLPNVRPSEPWLLAAGLVLAGFIAGLLYGLVAPKDYKATAQVLVSPVPASDTTFTGFDLFRETGGRHTAASSVAALLRSSQIADAVRSQLGLQRSTGALLSQLDTSQVDSSNVVAVTVDDSNAQRAAQIANSFASVLVSQRTANFLSQLANAIQGDESQLKKIPAASAEAKALAQRVAVLRGFQSQPDPTIRQAVEALPPTTSSGLGALAVAGIGAGGGVLAAVLALLGYAARDELRRRAAYAGPTYERRTFEQMAERLEGRVHERLDALASEEERLTDREREIAAREERLEARMEELRAAQEAGLGGSDAHMRQLSQREDALDKREQELAARHRELAAGLAELSRAREAADQRLDALIAEEQRVSGLEQALAQREQEAAKTIEQLRFAQTQPTYDEKHLEEIEKREQKLREGEHALAAAKAESELGEQELTALVAREAELSRREAELVEKMQELSERQQALTERELSLTSAENEVVVRQQQTARQEIPMPVLPPLFEPTPPAAPAPAAGKWNVKDLQRLVEEHAAEFPARVDEWRSYLFFLADHADRSGALPSQFDWLVEDTFSELLARSA